MSLFTDVFPCDIVVFKGNPGIILQVVPAAGTGSVERFAAYSDTCAHGNDQGIGGRFAVYSACCDIGVFDIRRDVVFHIVIGNARARAGFTVPASAHSGRDGDAPVLTQFVFGLVLIARGLVRNLVAIGIYLIAISILGFFKG